MECSRRAADNRSCLAPTTNQSCLCLLFASFRDDRYFDVFCGTWKSIVVGDICRAVQYVSFTIDHLSTHICQELVDSLKGIANEQNNADDGDNQDKQARQELSDLQKPKKRKESHSVELAKDKYTANEGKQQHDNKLCEPPVVEDNQYGVGIELTVKGKLDKSNEINTKRRRKAEDVSKHDNPVEDPIEDVSLGGFGKFYCILVSCSTVGNCLHNLAASEECGADSGEQVISLSSLRKIICNFSI